MISRLLLFLSLASPILAQDGQQLFTLYCSACHGADGKGATGGTFPPLAESPWLAGDADRAVKITLKGLTGPVDVLGKTYNLEMPPQGAVLPDDQIAAILTYARSAWGNQAGPVTADQVKAIRATVEDRKMPWTAEELLKLHPLPLEKTALTNLLSQAYSGKWSSMPDFSKLKAANIEEEHDGIISLKKAPFEDDFAIVWQADFAAPTDGEYQFLLDADDAAAVIIDGKNIVEIKGAGPMNGSRARQGKVTLTQGSHKLRVEFLELSDKQGIALGWKEPGGKHWKWISDQSAKPAKVREPIPIESANGRPVIYRNFIAGASPRAIGVGFPGGLNLAYSADNLAPELLWTGKFIDGAAKWIERGTDNNPPAGENIAAIGIGKYFSEGRFLGYKLDPAGNPTFLVKIGDIVLSDSWRAESGTLVRKLSIIGKGRQNVMFGDNLKSQGTTYSDQNKLTIDVGNAEVWSHKGREDVIVTDTKPATLTYRWK
ncbi:MAG: c-type cytochrome [Verrucomicrobiota bacterium]